MSERYMSSQVMPILKAGRLDPVRIENMADIGTPDINYKDGILELKQISHWPRTRGAVRIDHFTKQQRIALRRRWHVGGNAYLLLRVTPEWLLFDGETAAKTLGLCPREELYAVALRVWKSKSAMKEELAACLSRPQT